ncbi:hypothetical protein ACIG5E_18940 [Kitasatospora sp. NPDC053057]|uniref:hypothetical protein n=1 Tax=Kitasatospora sp. NPDC053057 TaxID=3364062 RepID=UPI0037CB8C4E
MAVSYTGMVLVAGEGHDGGHVASSDGNLTGSAVLNADCYAGERPPPSTNSPSASGSQRPAV